MSLRIKYGSAAGEDRESSFYRFIHWLSYILYILIIEYCINFIRFFFSINKLISLDEYVLD